MLQALAATTVLDPEPTFWLYPQLLQSRFTASCPCACPGVSVAACRIGSKFFAIISCQSPVKFWHDALSCLSCLLFSWRLCR